MRSGQTTKPRLSPAGAEIHRGRMKSLSPNATAQETEGKRTALEREDSPEFQLERRARPPDSSARCRALKALLVSKSKAFGDVLHGPLPPQWKASLLLRLC